MRGTLRAFPTLLKIGFAEAVAYRAEMFVWMLSTTMPLVNLALWRAIAAASGGTVGGLRANDLTAYFLVSLIVRQLTGTWVVWNMNQELRSGTFSLRLLKPIHPLVSYAAENLSAMPLRAGLVVPVAIAILFAVDPQSMTRSPLVVLAAVSATVAAWVIAFSTSAIIGTLGFYVEQSTAIFDVYLAAYFALSGYLFPLELVSLETPRATAVLHALPFYYLMGFPVEVALGRHDLHGVLVGLAASWSWAIGLGLFSLLFWRRGVARWNAFGA